MCVCLTVEAIAGSRAQVATEPSNETVCCSTVWTGGSAEDIVGSRREEEGRKGREEIL